MTIGSMEVKVGETRVRSLGLSNAELFRFLATTLPEAGLDCLLVVGICM